LGGGVRTHVACIQGGSGKSGTYVLYEKINSDVVLFLQTRRLRSSLNREQELIFVAILLMLNVCDICSHLSCTVH